MALFSLFGNSKDTFLVFDIGSASVSAALVRERHTAIEIIASERIEIPIGENVRIDRLERAMLKAVTDAAELLRKRFSLRRMPVYVTLASPWYASETRRVHIDKSAPFAITTELLKAVTDKEVSDYKAELSKKMRSKDTGLALIESEVIRITLNEYETAQPLGKSAKRAELTLYLSFANDNILKTVAERLYGFTHSGQVSFRTFPLAYFSTVRDLYPKKNDYLLMDVSGELTEVSLVRHGILVETSSFPRGKNYLLRRLATDSKQSTAEAASLLALHEKHSLSPAEHVRVEACLTAVREEWLVALGKTLTELSQELYVPGEVFLAIDDDVSDLYASWITADSTSQYALTHEKFRAIPFGKTPLPITRAPGCHPTDIALVVDALFARKFIEEARS